MSDEYLDRDGTRDEIETLQSLDGEELMRRFEEDIKMLWDFFPDQCREKLFDGLEPYEADR